jgi:hypothetical protein
MESKGSRRIGGLLLAALVVSGCIEPQATTGPSASASPTTVEASPTPAPTSAAVASPEPTSLPTAEPTVEPTIEPEPTEMPCPTARLLNVREFVGAPWRCFAGEDVRIKGWLDTPPASGYEGPAAIYPLWLAYPESGPCNPPADDCSLTVAIWQDVPLDPDHICSDEEPSCSLFFPHSAPGTGLHFLPLEHWVILTGHTDDPAAERCHWEYGPDVEPGTLDDADAVARCRAQFVVTEIDRAN